MRAHSFVIAGRSGCGKGTQTQLLAEYLKEHDPARSQYHLVTGDKFRAFMKGNDHSHELAREVMESGGLMPQFLAIWVWAGAFIENLRGDEHIFIDGAPRVVSESDVLDSAFKFYKREKPNVVLLNVSRETSRERMLSRGRHDDNGEAIEKRLDWYEEQVVPAIEFFRGRDDYHFIDVDGERPAEEVHREIIERLALN